MSCWYHQYLMVLTCFQLYSQTTDAVNMRDCNTQSCRPLLYSRASQPPGCGPVYLAPDHLFFGPHREKKKKKYFDFINYQPFFQNYRTTLLHLSCLLTHQDTCLSHLIQPKKKFLNGTFYTITPLVVVCALKIYLYFFFFFFNLAVFFFFATSLMLDFPRPCFLNFLA